MQQLEGHSGAITCLHFDSQRIISGSLDFDIKFWRIDNGLCINTLNWITKEGRRDLSLRFSAFLIPAD